MTDQQGIHWSVWITRLIGLWVLVGAALKLLWGAPENLPEIVQQLPLPLELTFRIAVAAEICIGLMALLRPRWSWLLLIVLLVLFDVALATQIAAGKESCGCFGAHVPISPLVMLIVDSVLLLVLLASRPWSTPGSDATGGLIAIIVVVGAAILPWVLDREVSDPSQLENAVLPPLVRLRVDSWPDKALADTDLAPWVDLEPLPDSALWIFYRDTCSVCADLLSWIANTEDGSTREIVLVRLPDEEGETPKAVHTRPEQPWVHEVELADTEWAFTAPGAMLVRDGTVVWAVEGLGGVGDFQAADR